MLTSPQHATQVFNLLDGNRHVSILGLNDDIMSDYETTVEIMNVWFGSRWPRKLVWERDWHPVIDRLHDKGV
jgi:3-O-alpha-D-mannopyranosyl-alpha-D-mannopyranose xylosylphosphotransferase